jgi:V8-like Glu-specific endopeptidase
MLHRLVGIGALAALSACAAQTNPSDHRGAAEADADDAELSDVDEAKALELINGAPTGGAFGNVGVILFRPNPNDMALCTGTIISPHVVLTAGHCVTGDDGAVVRVGDQGDIGFSLNPSASAASGQYMAVARIVRHPSFVAGETGINGSGIDGIDVALIALEAPVTAPPSSLAAAAPALGASSTAVGYGVDEKKGIGDRKSGTILYAGVFDASFVGLAAGTIFQFNPGPSGTTACNGDSGGPIFDGSGRVLAIVSAGEETCTQGFIAASMVSANAWVTQTAASLEQAFAPVVGPQPQPQPSSAPVVQPTKKPTRQPVHRATPTPKPKKKVVKLPKKKPVKRPPPKPKKPKKKRP